MTPRTSLPEAQRIIDRDYEALRPKVLASLRGKLAGHNVHVDAADLDAYYNQAWHALYSQLVDGRTVDNIPGFLVVVAYRRGIEDLRSSGDDTYHAQLDADVGREQDIPELLDDQARLRHLVEGMRERLDERERTAAVLCLIHGYSRSDAAEALGVSRKRIEKIMDGVQRKLAALTGDIDEGWCENRRSLIVAYSLGMLEKDGARYQAATEHLEDCSACRRYVATSRGLAGILPPVGLPVLLASVGTASGGAAAARHGSPSPRPPRGRGKSLAAAAVAAGVLAVAGIAYAAVEGGGDDPPSPPAPAAARAATGAGGAAVVTASQVAPAAASFAASAGSASRDAAAAQRAAHRRAAARRQRLAAAPPVASPPPVAPAEPPTPTPVAEPQPPAAGPAPAASPAPKPASKPDPVITDGAQEFGLEQGAAGG